MIDLKRTFYSHVDSQAIATGMSVSEEGQALVAVLQNGIEVVQPSSAAGGEVVVGFAVFRQKDFTTRPIVEDVVVPNALPYTVDLSYQQLISGQLRVHDVVANTDLTVIVSPAVPTSSQVAVDSATGILTFNAAAAGKTYRAFYRFNLTLSQAKQYFYEAPTNYPDPNFFASVGVGKGKGRIFTAHYDDSVNWATAASVKAGANGILTTGAGTVIAGARVVQVPAPGSNSTMLLGVEFSL